MREIVPDVFTWSRFSEPHGYDFNGYLIVHADGNLCIDPVLPDDPDLDAIARRGVAKILLSQSKGQHVWRMSGACCEN